MALTTSYSEETAVYEYSYTAGTGPYTLAGAWSTHLAFSDRYPAGATGLPYYVKDGSSGNGSQFEINTGNYNATAKTLTRGTPLASSNGGALVNWSGRTRLLIRPLIPAAVTGGGGGGGGTPGGSVLCCGLSDAVYFDGLGTSVYRTSLDGVSDSPFLTLSYWISVYDAEFGDVGFNYWGGLVPDATHPGYFFTQYTTNDGFVYFSTINPGPDQILTREIGVGGNSGAWINVLVSIDASQNPPAVSIFNGETDVTGLDVSTGPFSIPFSQTGLVIGDANSPIGNSIDGMPPTLQHRDAFRYRMAYFWYAPGVFLPFTDPANRAKFHDLSTGLPVDLGANGQLPTGTSPAVFLWGPKGQFPINYGTGGSFGVTRNLEDALGGGPLNPIPLPARTRGAVRWVGSGIMAAEDDFNIPDSAVFAFSFWLRMDAAQASTAIIYSATLNAGVDPALWIKLNTTGHLLISLAHLTGPAPGGVADRQRDYTQTSNAIPADGKWHHVALSGDTQALTFQLYIDRTAATVSFVDSVGSGAFTIAYSITTDFLYWWWFGSGSGADNYVGDSAEFWGDLANKIDFSLTANLDRFESLSLNSSDLGVDGSLPTGSPPTYYFSQTPIGYDAITFFTNRARDTSSQRELFSSADGGLDFVTVAPGPYP